YEHGADRCFHGHGVRRTNLPRLPLMMPCPGFCSRIPKVFVQFRSKYNSNPFCPVTSHRRETSSVDRKRLFRTVLAVAVTLCIGAHCTAAPVEVVFWHPFDSGTPRDAIEELIEVFNASRDDIRVVGQVVPDLIEKVRVA